MVEITRSKKKTKMDRIKKKTDFLKIGNITYRLLSREHTDFYKNKVEKILSINKRSYILNSNSQEETG